MTAKNLIVVIFALLLALPFSASAAIFRYDGPYEGKVVDADTGGPIEGAVVLGVWYRIHPNVAGWSSEFYDSVETLTDKDGNFYIKGLGVLLMSNIDTMNIIIYKSGYKHLGSSWESFKDGYRLREIVKWEGDKAIVPLKRLNFEQRRKYGADVYVDIPENNKKLLLNEIHRERIEIYGDDYGRENE